MHDPAVCMQPRKASLQKKFENVSEGGLDLPRTWYITETVIYHQPKVTRQGPPGSASRTRVTAAPPDRMTSPST